MADRISQNTPDTEGLAALADSRPDADTGQERRTLLQRGADFLFGYDYFISYSWADGRRYAADLKRELGAMGFECFLDSSDYGKGENWKIAGRRAIQKTARLILVGSPGALASDPVVREVEAFNRTGRTVVPIDFGGSLFPKDRSAPVFEHLPPETLAIREEAYRLVTGPSEEALQDLRAGFVLQRQDKKRVRWLSATAIVLVLLLVASVVAAMGFVRQRQEAERQRQEAERQRDSAVARLLSSEGFRQGASSPRAAARYFLTSLALQRTANAESGLLQLVQSDPHLAMHLLSIPVEMTAVQWHPKPETALIGLKNGEVWLWKPEMAAGGGEAALLGAEPILHVKGSDRPILAVALTDDEQAVRAVDASGAILEWRSPLKESALPETLDRIPTTAIWESLSGSRPEVRMSGDGSAVALASIEPLKTFVWRDGVGVEEVEEQDLALGGPLALSSDGRLLVGAIGGEKWERNPVVLIDLSTGSKSFLKGYPFRLGFVTALAFDPTGRKLAAGTWHGVVLVWDSLDKGPREVHRPEWGEGFFNAGREVSAILVGGDLRYLATAARGKWQIWDPATGIAIGTPMASSSILGAYDPSGQRLLMKGGEGFVQIVDHSRENLQELGCRLAAGNFSKEEWQTLLGDIQYSCPCPREPGCGDEHRGSSLERYEGVPLYSLDTGTGR